ncbi:hypothetical protein [Neptuniibacter sp.]|uniref:hypothetical protein n=1 Tax=Neptuniibacter sp. TaxID=1962643 RepID=UPI0026208B25|nr:hypothetical protein [Neptuniibacter sp.]MCP4597633.1 hypothetical protein [Neptuniibacter sp.]
MPYQTNAWTAAQLEKMNNETFMVDFLDTFKISPVVSKSESTIDDMNEILARVEAKLGIS